MKRARRTALTRIRKSIAINYHNLSEVLMDDHFDSTGMPVDDYEDGEADAAFDKLDEAINCLNRELGRPVDS